MKQLDIIKEKKILMKTHFLLLKKNKIYDKKQHDI